MKKKYQSLFLVLMIATALIISDCDKSPTKSDENGENGEPANFWQQVYEEPYGCTSVAAHPNGDIFIGSSKADGSVLYSTNNGDSWIETALTGSRTRCFGFNSQGHIFTGTNLALFRSTDNGATWVETGLSRASNCIAFNLSGHIFVGCNSGLYCSVDNGDTWDVVDFSQNGVKSIAINAQGRIFAGVYGKGIFRSTDNGETWPDTCLQDETVISFAINSQGHIFAGSYTNVFRSTDNGATWVETNLDKSAVIVISPNGDIFAGSAGVSRSTDNGNSWVEINDGLTNLDVQDLAISPSGYIFAATLGGIFRSSEPITSE